MNKIVTYFLLISFMLTVNIEGVFAQKKSKKDTETNTDATVPKFEFDQNLLTNYLSYLYTENQWQGSVAILHNGKPIYSKAFGKLAENNNRDADSGTKYRIGSITKMYTATLIYDLIEKNKLQKDTKLKQFFPQIPNAKTITIEQLLGHRSGLHNYTDDEDFDFYKAHSKVEMLNLFESQKPSFKPGEKFEYSNTNYYLLGMIVEQITGKSFEDQVKSVILAKQMLMSTRIGDNEINPNQNETISWTWDNDAKNWQAVPSWDIENAFGAGDISASASDVCGFLNGLFTNKIVPENQVSNFLTVDELGLGHGSILIPFYNKKSYGHTGGIEGFQSVASYFPEEKISFALLSSGLNMSNNDVAIGVLSILFGEPYEFPTFSKEVKPITDPNQYVGDYGSKQIPLDIKVFYEDNQLYAQATGQSKFPLTQNEKGDFEFKLGGITLKFFDLENNQYQSMILVQGKEYQFSRE